VGTHEVDAAESARLHELLMDVVRAASLLQAGQSGGGQAVSLSQLLALHELDTGRPVSQQELAERLRLEKSSVSRLAAELERNGLLARERDPDNQRQYRLRITDHGRAVHAQMRHTFHRHYEGWAAAMTPGERAALLKGLPALVRVLRQHHTSP
jgi:DNA-binding MarR family transcriptional regulator